MNYVITIEANPRSVQVARRCIRSGAKNGTLIQMFPAVTPHNTDIYEMAKKEGINIDGFKEQYSRLDNCVAAFLSHYSLWKQAAERSEVTTIFEHDAVVVNNIDSQLTPHVAVNLGAPSYGKFNTPNLGVGPLTSKPYFPGCHAYIVTPMGAKLLTKRARREAGPADVFLHISRFGWLQEYYPYCAYADDSFSTVQNHKGTIAKHNYSDEYELIDV